jgi:polyhydroxyalkanoate synthesis regulator protein
MTSAFGIGAFAPLEEQVRRNMELFERTFSMFKPFALQPRKDEAAAGSEPAKESGEIDDLRKQMKEMQDKLEKMSKEGGGKE